MKDKEFKNIVDQKTEHHNNHCHNSDNCHNMNSDSAKEFLKRFWIVTFLLIPLFIFTEKGISILGLTEFYWRRYVQFGFATAVFYFSLIFYQHAWHEIKSRNLGMMTLVSLAISAGYSFSVFSTFFPKLSTTEFYLEISTLIWVLLFGHYLEAKSSISARSALDEVEKLLPKTAHLVINNNLETEEIPIDKLKTGNKVLVRSGEKIPADGIVIEGSAYVDESLSTGESSPTEKTVNDKVIAGSICLDAQLIIKLTQVGENSTVGQIKQLINKASQTKPKTQKLADKAASVLTLTALITALATVVIWSLIIGKPFVFSLTLAITVLVIACPHALGLAIPTVSTIATSLAVKNGFFIKDLSKLEIAKDINYIIFDKTGTLTEGKFQVEQILIAEKKLNKTVAIALAASLEQGSSHPIAQAILNYAKKHSIKLNKVDDYKIIPGKGTKGKIKNKIYYLGSPNFAKEITNFKNLPQLSNHKTAKTKVVLFDKDKIFAIILLGDKIKKEAYIAIKEIHSLNIKTAMLTGDNESIAKETAEKLKIDNVFAEVKPEDKYKHIRDLQQKGYRVMMVGDGINDAPALMQADIGLAIAKGTDLAVSAGDVILTRNNPKDAVTLIKLSKAVYKKMIENLIWALGYNIIAIPTAAGLFIPLGIKLKPEWAALIMSLSSVIVVINAIRLKSFKP
ncbi:MAG: heavy metal translocating P-type ATPase [Patescibacteria group bacterium]|nr:MAG: heavy metal translocating P-type ATPase [Patescibacteria group bacterium]